jgi:hypothetical protein
MEREGKSTPEQGKRREPVLLGDLLSSSIIPSAASRTESDRPRALGAGDRASELEARTSTVQEKRSEIEFYSELNLNRFPFASLWDKDAGKPGSIVCRRSVKAGETESSVEWIVRAETTGGKEDYQAAGLPGPFERKVFRALERIILGRTIGKGLPLANPHPIETKEILETLRMTVQTINYRRVTQALARLKSAQISCTGIVTSRKATPSRGALFSPLSEIWWAGTKDPHTGNVVRKTQLYFPQIYLDSVNSHNLRPIDWDLWLALGQRPVAQRLYEILEMRFFGLKDSPYVVFGYEELCQLMPMRRQERPHVAMHTLDRGHDLLKNIAVRRSSGTERVSLLEKIDWAWDGPVGTLRYYPHRDYMARLRSRRTPEFDPRAMELASEFGDLKSLAFYQRVVSRVDWQYVQAARTEVRQNRKLTDPGRYFSATLRRILKATGQDVPFGNEA